MFRNCPPLGANSAYTKESDLPMTKTPIVITLLLPVLALPISAQTMEIDRRNPVSGKTLTTTNKANVTVVLKNKSPFETCTMDNKRDVIAPDTSAVASLISLGVSAAGAFTGFRIPSASPQPEPPPKPDAGKLIIDRLDALTAAVGQPSQPSDPNNPTPTIPATGRSGSVGKVVNLYAEEAHALKGFFTTLPDPKTFETLRSASATAVDQLLKATLPSTADLELLYKTILDLTSKYEADPAADANNLAAIHQKIELVRSQLDSLTGTLTDLTAARTKLKAVSDYLATLSMDHPDLWSKTFTLNADTDAKISGTISCSDTQTKEVTLTPVYFTVTYQNLPRFTVSAGVLISFVPKQTFAINAVLDSRSTGTTATFHNEITEDKSRPQLVPFSLANLRFKDWKHWDHQFTLNYTAGFGVNPNGGTSEAEFAPVGLSLGIGSFYVSAVGHWARTPGLSGGFQVGDHVSSDVKSPPLMRSWNPGFAFGITYKLPLPK